MELRYIPPPKNARRMPYLILAAKTFEEERILCSLCEVMDRGGTIDISINECGKFPAREVTCDFKGVPDVSAQSGGSI